MRQWHKTITHSILQQCYDISFPWCMVLPYATALQISKRFLHLMFETEVTAFSALTKVIAPLSSLSCLELITAN